MKNVNIVAATRRAFERRPDEAYTFDEVLEQFERWGAKAFRCQRGEHCFRAGTPATHFLLVNSGALHVKQPVIVGDDILLRAVRPGEYCGLTLIYSHEEMHPFDVIAAVESEIITFGVEDVRKWRTDPRSQPLFDYIGRNLGALVRETQVKNMILSAHDNAERLRRYLSVRMQREQSRTIEIPGSLEELAHYLGVNRCALSRTIGKLRDEGKLEYHDRVIKVLK